MKVFLAFLLFFNALLLANSFLQDTESTAFLVSDRRATNLAKRSRLRSKSRQDESSRANLEATNLKGRTTISRFLDIRPFPDQPVIDMSQEDRAIIERAIQQARLLALNILRLRRGDALYARIMGDPTGENYDIAMQQVRRVLNLLGNDDGLCKQTLMSPTFLDLCFEAVPGGETEADRVSSQLTFMRQDQPRGFEITGDQDPTRALAASIGSLIILYQRFFDADETLGIMPGRETDINDPAILDRAAESRGAIMFHELLHFVSQGQMGEVLRRARDNGARISGINTNVPRITDVRLGSFAATPGSQQASNDGNVLFEIDPQARAYHHELTSRLARLTFGRYAAAMNADSYTMLAVAATINFANTNFRPSGSAPFPDPPNFPTSQHSIYGDESDSEFLANALERLSANRPVRGSLSYLEKVVEGGWLRKDHEGL